MTKKTSGADEDLEGMVEGVSSAHSWIKAQTMIRPVTLGAVRATEDDDEEGDDNNEILITLTSRNPNDSYSQVW